MANLIERAQEHFFRCNVYDQRLGELEDKIKEEVQVGASSRLKAMFESVQQLRVSYMEDHKAGVDFLQRSTAESRINVLKEQQQLYSSAFGRFDDMILDIKSALIEIEEKVPQQTFSKEEEHAHKIPKIEFRSFDEDDPELWFSQLEIQFEALGLSEDRKRFVSLMRLLGNEQADIVGAISVHPPPEPYKAAKEELVGAYAKSKTQ